MRGLRFRFSRGARRAAGFVRRLPIPVIVLALGGIGLIVLLLVQASGQRSDFNDCLDEDLLPRQDCERVHEETATLFTTGAVVVGLLLVVGLIAQHLVRKRTRRDRNGGEGSGGAKPEGDATAGAPLRVCRVCSAQSRTAADKCPHCGASFIRSPIARWRRRAAAAPRRSLLGALAATLAFILLVGGAVATFRIADDRSAEAARLAEEEEERLALEAEREAEREARELEQLDRELRRTLVNDLEESITEDAQEEASQEFSLIDGPILDTECDPAGGVIRTDVTTQRFSCIAITDYTGGGAYEGYRYSADVNYEQFSYRWRLGGGGL